MQWDAVGIWCRVWMDAYPSSAGSFHWGSSGAYIAEKVDTGKQKRTHLGIFLVCSKTEKKWWILLQPSVLLHHIAVEELTTGIDFCCSGLPLPDPAVCFEQGAQVFRCKTLQIHQRDISQREKKPKKGCSYEGLILCLKHIDIAKDKCKMWITVTSSHSQVHRYAYI